MYPAAMAATNPTLSSQAKARSFSKAGRSDAQTAKTMIIREWTRDTTCIDLNTKPNQQIRSSRCSKASVHNSPVILKFLVGFPVSLRKESLTELWGDNQVNNREEQGRSDKCIDVLRHHSQA